MQWFRISLLAISLWAAVRPVAVLAAGPPLPGDRVERVARAVAGGQVGVGALIRLVEDEELPDPLRARAVREVGKHGGAEALAFLVAEVSLELDPHPGFSSDRGKQVCFGALVQHWGGDKALADAVFARLDSRVSFHEFSYLALLLQHVLPPDLALKAVERELAKRPPAPRQRNLLAVRKRLLQRY